MVGIKSPQEFDLALHADDVLAFDFSRRWLQLCWRQLPPQRTKTPVGMVRALNPKPANPTISQGPLNAAPLILRSPKSVQPQPVDRLSVLM